MKLAPAFGSLFAALLACWLGCNPAVAQSITDDVDDCDMLAAHPGDPDRLSDGLADDAIIPRLAIKACEAAIARAPDTARFHFQLGRAYAAAGRRDDAVAQYRTAAGGGDAAALAYMGDAYQFGQGVPADPGKALEAYRHAAAGRFTAAEGQIEMLTFDRNLYVIPVVNLLHTGDLSTLRADTPALQSYLFGFVMALTSECGAVLTPGNVATLYSRRYPQNWTPEADAPVNVSVMASISEYDAKTFLHRHGCEGPVAARIKSNLNRLYEAS